MTILTDNSTVPATREPSVLRRFLRWIWSCIQEIQARRVQTASLHHLKSRDLKDVGLIENDIAAAKSLPVGTDAVDALHRARLDRSSNW